MNSIAETFPTLVLYGGMVDAGFVIVSGVLLAVMFLFFGDTGKLADRVIPANAALIVSTVVASGILLSIRYLIR